LKEGGGKKKRMKGYRNLFSLIENSACEAVYPGAVILVAKGGKIVFHEPVGYRSLTPERAPMLRHTIFDLASLTKPLATTLCTMKLVNEDKILLDQPLKRMLPNAVLGDKSELTSRLLLCHSSGLADWKPFYENLIPYPVKERKRILREWIIRESFAYEPGKRNLYSDLGFMLLEWVIEEKTGETLPRYVHKHFYGPLGLKRTMFRSAGEDEDPLPPASAKGEGPDSGEAIVDRGGKKKSLDSRLCGSDRNTRGKIESIHSRDEFAATEDCPWRRRVLQGEVHDDNAWTLGGYSGHAGLFSTAEEVYVIANLLREHYIGVRHDFFRPETVREFFRRQDIVEGSDWALGWDTRALKGSSAGKHFSRGSVGHTGFTGTSMWMDLEKDVIAILLTNRVHPKRENDRIKQFRPAFHDAVMEELGLVD
jgi:CubicO group peptidase (beta-lactamase class C family)